MSFVVAIIGRPNVGKSTLFNRLVGQKIALVDDTPGVTRDRRRHKAKLQDLRFDVIDTAGLEEGENETLQGRMRAQTKAAIDEADLVLFVVDSKTGVIASDLNFASLLRKSGKPILLVANKAESKALTTNFYDAWQIGLGEPCPISAEHGLGMSDLRDAMVEILKERNLFEDSDDPMKEVVPKSFPKHKQEELLDPTIQESEEALDNYDPKSSMRIAIVGRPNVGKSTFINMVLQENRLLTGPEAGITRDSIAVDWQWHGREIKLFDTAGLRRKARVQQKLEKLSVGETLRAIRFAEVVVLMMDSTIPFEKQDLQIADLIIKEGRALVLAFNKWDLIENRQEYLAMLYEKCQRLLPQISGVRAVPISGAYGEGIEKIIENIAWVHHIWNKRISTGRLNKWLEKATAMHPPPAVAHRRIKIKYMTQVKTRPPSFVISCSRKEALPQSYLRYLVNGLRKDFNMPGVPIRLLLRSAENPFASRAKKR